jgi:hypothetical protein
MATDQGKNGGLGDDQGTRVGKPDHASPAQHSDAPTGRPERVTGAGGEALTHTDGSAEGHDQEHRSGYGGKGGSPDTPSDGRK